MRKLTLAAIIILGIFSCNREDDNIQSCYDNIEGYWFEHIRPERGNYIPTGYVYCLVSPLDSGYVKVKITEYGVTIPRELYPTSLCYDLEDLVYDPCWKLDPNGVPLCDSDLF